MDNLIEKIVLEVAENRKIPLTFYLTGEMSITGKIIHHDSEMVIIESQINGNCFYYKTSELRGYCSNDPDFKEEVMHQIKGVGKDGDSLSAYMPPNLNDLPDVSKLSLDTYDGTCES